MDITGYMYKRSRLKVISKLNTEAIPSREVVLPLLNIELITLIENNRAILVYDSLVKNSQIGVY